MSKRIGLHIKTLLLVVWVSSRGDGLKCPYGQKCNAYEPAPSGKAPPCALPGLTYCVQPEGYPEDHIRKLIDAGRYDVFSLLTDESRDDYDAKKPEFPYKFGPNSLSNVDQISLVNDNPFDYNDKFHNRYNHDIFSHKTPLQPPSAGEPSPYNINAYHASNITKFGYQGYHHTPPNNYWNPAQNQYDAEYDKKYYRQHDLGQNLGYNQNYYNTPEFDPHPDWSAPRFKQDTSGVTQYDPNDWWKYLISQPHPDVTIERSVTFPTRTSTVRRSARQRRNAELVKAASKKKLTPAEAFKIALGFASAEISAERPRRQAPGVQELCSARTDFVQPRAAQNNRGDWRYVVNMPENMTQLVRAEICTSTQCNGLCSIPIGFSSRCDQKYIQRRLVALQTSGDNLYVDLFWIPSCCQCTIVDDGSR